MRLGWNVLMGINVPINIVELLILLLFYNYISQENLGTLKSGKKISGI